MGRLRFPLSVLLLFFAEEIPLLLVLLLSIGEALTIDLTVFRAIFAVKLLLFEGRVELELEGSFPTEGSASSS